MSAICHAIANGGTFAGAPAQQRPVLILDRENPAVVITERFGRLGINDDGQRFKVWGGWCDSEPPGPDSPELKDWVMSSDPRSNTSERLGGHPKSAVCVS